MELTFSIEQHPQPHGRASRAVFRWIRAFGLHSASLVFRPSPFTVQVSTDMGEPVKGFPADSHEEAEELRELFQAECTSLGVHSFLVNHDAPSHFVTRAIHSS